MNTTVTAPHASSTFTDEYLDIVRQRDPNQPEFLQAVKEVVMWRVTGV